MNYCPRCHKLTAADRCGSCRKITRESRPSDEVLLVTLDHLHADMLAPLLEDAGIPFSRQCDMGGVFAIPSGMRLSETKFFVLYPALHRARVLIEDVFSDDPAVMNNLAESDGDTP